MRKFNNPSAGSIAISDELKALSEKELRLLGVKVRQQGISAVPESDRDIVNREVQTVLEPRRISRKEYVHIELDVKNLAWEVALFLD